jgi:hypothetical protein
MSGGNDRRMIRETQIVVGAKVEHDPAIGGLNAGVLRSHDDALGFAQAGGFDFAQRLLEMSEVRRSRHPATLAVAAKGAKPKRSQCTESVSFHQNKPKWFIT